MLFGRVKGTAVCTIKYPGTEGVKLLVVQPLNKRLEPIGILQVAADVVHAGPGDLCVMVRSREAALAMRDEKFVPIDLALIGIVDELEVKPDGTFDYTLSAGHNQFTYCLSEGAFFATDAAPVGRCQGESLARPMRFFASLRMTS